MLIYVIYVWPVFSELFRVDIGDPKAQRHRLAQMVFVPAQTEGRARRHAKVAVARTVKEILCGKFAEPVAIIRGDRTDIALGYIRSRHGRIIKQIDGIFLAKVFENLFHVFNVESDAEHIRFVQRTHAAQPVYDLFEQSAVQLLVIRFALRIFLFQRILHKRVDETVARRSAEIGVLFDNQRLCALSCRTNPGGYPR